MYIALGSGIRVNTKTVAILLHVTVPYVALHNAVRDTYVVLYVTRIQCGTCTPSVTVVVVVNG